MEWWTGIVEWNGGIEAPNMESVTLRITMALLHEEDDHNPQDKKGVEGRQTSEPEKVHSSGELIIVANFGDHLLCRLASAFQMKSDRQVGRQTKISV